jgi:hypothetical protein
METAILSFTALDFYRFFHKKNNLSSLECEGVYVPKNNFFIFTTLCWPLIHFIF